MGLKNKLNKMKSFLFDEEEEEKEIKKPDKKVSFKESRKLRKEKLEVEDFNTKKIDALDEDFFDTMPEEKEIKEEPKLRTEKKEPDFSFPEFDEDDFMTETKKEEVVEPRMEIRKEPREIPRSIPLYQGSKRKEEPRRFKPSPIMSPIYGLLDDEGNTLTEEQKDATYNEEVCLDDVRKKAYGNKEEEKLEDTIKNLSTKTIEEAEKEAEEREKKEEKLSRTKVKKVEEIKKVEVTSDDDEDDDMILPNINFKEIDVDKESGKKEEPAEIRSEEQEDDDDDTKEQDLFNLIDTMYQEEGNEE